MRVHPSILMVIVWISALAIFLILPFDLTYRSIEPLGLLIALVFIFAFCLGGFLRTIYLPQAPVFIPEEPIFKYSDLFLKILATIGSISMGTELILSHGADLELAYIKRSNQANAMLYGGISQSSMLFKIGFICYPAGYVYLVRCLIFDTQPRWLVIIIFGIAPSILAGLAMGGRAPIFLAMAYSLLAYKSRASIFAEMPKEIGQKVYKLNTLVKLAALVFIFLSMTYFVRVYIVRAAEAGGIEAMLSLAAVKWGVTFSGALADNMIYYLGAGVTYIIFVFIWYFIQGIIISNSVFVNYTGEPMLGVYGADILTAIVRRIDRIGLSNNFNNLNEIGVYGFLPSAFGTLFVDFLFYGVAVALFWGWLSGVVYRNIRLGQDFRWFIFGPFVTLGVIFSLVNTPLGFSNGFITHLWLIVAFLLSRKPSYKQLKG